MSKKVQANSSVIAAITSLTDFVGARKEADKLAEELGLTVADMPLLIQAMNESPETRYAIRDDWIDTLTGEYYGQRNGKRFYEVWHSAGSLSTATGLEKAFSETDNPDFMNIHDDEWNAAENGRYYGQNVARIHLEDVKNDKVPNAGTPYTIFARLDKDVMCINNAGQLSYDAFIQDDRVLMITGSLENRAILAKLIFGKREDGGQGWNTFGSYHKIHSLSFDATTKGRLTCVNLNYGIDGRKDFMYLKRCFVAVKKYLQKSKSPEIAQPTHRESASQKLVQPMPEEPATGEIEVLAREKSAPDKIIQPMLDDILLIINNYRLTTKEKEKAVRGLYKR